MTKMSNSNSRKALTVLIRSIFFFYVIQFLNGRTHKNIQLKRLFRLIIHAKNLAEKIKKIYFPSHFCNLALFE